MKKEIIQTMKIALAGFIEELLQSESGPCEDDIKYILSEREYIRQMEMEAAA